MEFNTFKMKLKRWLNRLNVGFFGAVGTTLMVLSLLLTFGSSLLLMGESEVEPDFYSLFSLIINVLFYFLLTKDFLAAKENNSLPRARYAILVIVIFEYVLPVISLLFGGLLMGSLVGVLAVSFSILISGTVIGAAYFIFLILEYRNKMNPKKIYIVMSVLGGILLILSTIYCVTDFIFMFEDIEMLVASAFSFPVLLNVIGYIFSSFAHVFFGITFLLYPYIKLREIKNGY